ncbi:MAG: sugar ABC transporter permease [Armatimonadetes bacterium RBG_19FT_COMBO_69_19]|nr:MAG: sugar ABC transporter permease [Armatimonadetes bacterium RBG_19FT_COMBO_69_19]
MKGRLLLLQIAAPALAILFGMVISSIIILAIGRSPLEVFGIMVRFSLGRTDSLFSILFKSTPLILSGLAVAMSFRVNLFNIGVEGQYYIGAFFAAYVGFSLRGLPAAVHLPLALLAAALGGMVWGLLPIILKLRRGAHEVITTIMMNYIASAVLLYLINDIFRDPSQAGTPRVRTPDVAAAARIPSLGPLFAQFGLTGSDVQKLNALLLLGVLLAIVLAFVLARTRFGYEVRVVSANPEAAEAAGIPNARVQFWVFMLSAGVAGLIGLNDILGFFGYLDIDFPKGLGFLGISIALLAKNNPIGVIPAALLFGFLDRGAQGVQFFARVPKETIVIMQAIIILAIVVAYELMTRYIRIQRKREAEATTPTAPRAAEAGS